MTLNFNSLNSTQVYAIDLKLVFAGVNVGKAKVEKIKRKILDVVFCKKVMYNYGIEITDVEADEYLQIA